MGVYTKTGDKGTTGLFTGQRVPKDCLRVETYGTVDEINSALGMARAACNNMQVKNTILKLQKMNMSLMAELASLDSKPYITLQDIEFMEQAIDNIDGSLPPLTSFVIAGDTKGGAALDMARTITRRAERLAWRLSSEETVNETLIVALNRQSDLCFMLMRLEEQSA